MDKQVEKEKEAIRLFSADRSCEIYRQEQTSHLPESVQRYFLNVLKEGQPYVSSVYLKYNGQLRTSLKKGWINIEGEKYFTTDEPGFLWLGKTSLFSGRSTYISGKGRIKVSLLNLFKIADREGPQYDQLELLQWLGESVWFPTNLLPDSRLNWTPIDEDSAKLSFQYNCHSINYKIRLNEKGEITQLETQCFNDGWKNEPLIIKVTNYKEIDGMKIPMNIGAFRKLPDNEHCYVWFNVRKIHYN